MIDISIIIPVFNAEEYIEKCLHSVLNQTKKEIEVLVLNDGSKDNTEEIIKRIKDKRLKYFKHKNVGIGKTRNIGIEKAKGKYITFMDADDYIEKDMLEKLFNKAENYDLDIVLSDFYKEYDNGNREEVHTPYFENASLKDNSNIITEYLSPWGKLYKRDLLVNNNIKFVEDSKYEDAPFVIEALDKSKKIGKIQECLYYYLIHSNSQTTVVDRRTFDIFKIVKIIRDYSKDKEYLNEKIDKLTVRILTNYTIQQRYQKSRKTAMEFIDKAFTYLKKEVPDYRNNKYYSNRGLLKRTIEKSKLLTKIYCLLYKRSNKV